MSSGSSGTRRVRSLSLGFTFSALALVLTLQSRAISTDGFAATVSYSADQARGVIVIPPDDGAVFRLGARRTTDPATLGLIGPGLAHDQATYAAWIYSYLVPEDNQGKEPPYKGQFWLSKLEQDNSVALGKTPPATTLTAFRYGRPYFVANSGGANKNVPLYYDPVKGYVERPYKCGNGFVEGEQHYPAATVGTMTYPAVDHATEQCDDGNQVDDDLCRNNCTLPNTNLAQCVPSSDAKVKVTVVDPVPGQAGLLTGQSADFEVTMKNVGLNPWSAAQGYHLRVASAATDIWNVRTVALAQNETIAPGQSKTFTFRATAPAAAGAKTAAYGMAKTTGTTTAVFPVVCDQAVTVMARENKAVIMEPESFPQSLVGGQSYTFKYAVKNDGTTVWTGATHALFLKRKINGQEVASRIDLGANTVQPGQSFTFLQDAVLPTDGGNAEYSAQMGTGVRNAQNGSFSAVTLFGNIVSKTASIAALRSNGTISIELTPAYANDGKTFTFKARVRNTGTVAFKPATHGLRATQTAGNAAIYVGVFALPEEIAVGAPEKEYTFTAPAPAVTSTVRKPFRVEIFEGTRAANGTWATATAVGLPAEVSVDIYACGNFIKEPGEECDYNSYMCNTQTCTAEPGFKCNANNACEPDVPSF